MAKNRSIEVKGVIISVTQKVGDDFISLSDIASGFEGGTALIEKWTRTKSTIEFLAVWESLNNPNFNSTEYEGIRSEAGSNRFVMSIKQWIEKTNAIGLTAKAGRYGGTYGHKDIALEFCSWLSPEFKLLLIKEFQRLKEQESELTNQEWDLRRLMSKINYEIHTEAIKNHIIPELSDNQKIYIYANEAEILNVALFGISSKEWREKNAALHNQKYNIRDFADLHQLTVLSNLESYNSILIQNKLSPENRLQELTKTAINQLTTLQSLDNYTLDKLKSPNQKRIESKNE
jgi:phage regulator Rha-like protein